jgi:NAD(P)H dehydrogenase (quinone)
MTNVAIIYFSGTGHTHLMAEAVAIGAKQIPDTTVQLLRITGEQIVKGRWEDQAMIDVLNQADAIVFGSPTYIGNVAAQFKAFVDAAGGIWQQQGWKNKMAGGFTHSGSPSGDKQATLLSMAIIGAQHSMIWVGAGEMMQPNGVNRLGSFMGVMGQATFDPSKAAELDAGDRLSCELYGKRIAESAARWHR